MVSSAYFCRVLAHAMIKHLERPPRLCFSRVVSLDSLNGTYLFPFVLEFSDKMLMTCLRVNKDLLISIPSFVTFDSSEFEYEYRSDPAKSTKFNVEVQFPWFMVIVKIACDLEDEIFKLFESMILFLLHLLYSFKICEASCHFILVNPSIVTSIQCIVTKTIRLTWH